MSSKEAQNFPGFAEDNRRLEARKKIMRQRHEEIISKGYEIVKEYEIGFGTTQNDYNSYKEEPGHFWEYKVYVWKDGFFGIIDGRTGEELSPCVHLSTHDAEKDVLKFQTNQGIKEKSLQKILIETLGINQYDPYVGAIVRQLFKILSLPNGNGTYVDHKISEEQCKFVAPTMYKLVEKKIKAGGINLKVYDYGETQEFKDFCRELEEVVVEEMPEFKTAKKENGAITGHDIVELQHVHLDGLSEEARKKVFADMDKYDEILEKYISFSSALEQIIKLKRFTSKSLGSIFNREISLPSELKRIIEIYDQNNSLEGEEFELWKAIKHLYDQQPVISISAEKTIYCPDVNNPNAERVVILADAYKKGMQIDGTPITAGVR